ncbi:MAG TPA: hypothetical protein VEJ63_14570 [Planctomycetota bacterium]|nr:hypothetical protein [Planctomycetota bacterium]
MRTLIAFILAGLFASVLPGCGQNYNNPNRPGTSPNSTTPSTGPSTSPNTAPRTDTGVNNTPATPAPATDNR